MDTPGTAPTSGRSPRDWFVDACLFLLAAVFGVVMSAMRLEGEAPPESALLFNLDQAAGAFGCAAVWFRRRWPEGVAVVLVVLSTFSEFVAGAMLVALFSVAIHRPPRKAMSILGLSLLAALVYVILRPEPDTPRYVVFLLGAAIQGGAVGWGLYVRHRRQLASSLRERAAQTETEARLRAEQAHREARDAIAREIHDVLGHRLSLLSVHAGALEYRPDSPPEDVARSAKVIRESAHQALQDLRDVIGVLRAPVQERPEPTLADLRRLVAESEQAGMEVELSEELAGPVPERVGRAAYRIVQEALTNARKHAAGSTVSVRLTGSSPAGLIVEIRNSAPITAADAGRASEDAPGRTAGDQEGGPDPRPGQGLAGLAERAALVDGRLEHGPTADGGWVVSAWLPWPA